MQRYLLPLGTIREIGEPIEGYLIHRNDGTNVLVDTGCPRDMVGDETAPFAVGQDDHIVRRLASVGLEPANIHLVICTHLERWGGLALRHQMGPTS